jgi:hypothetical protein
LLQAHENADPFVQREFVENQFAQV